MSGAASDPSGGACCPLCTTVLIASHDPIDARCRGVCMPRGVAALTATVRCVDRGGAVFTTGPRGGDPRDGRSRRHTASDPATANTVVASGTPIATSTVDGRPRSRLQISPMIGT